jgi:hypothetical protein
VTQPQNEAASALGGTVGGKLTRLVADATVHTKQRLAGHQAGVAQKIMADFTNHVSDEVRSVMGPLWRQMLDDPDVPDDFKPLLKALATQRGQAWAWIAGTATGAAMAGGLVNLLSNALNPVIFKAIQAAPHNVLSPDVAATLAQRGLAAGFDPYYDSSANGIDRDRYESLIRLVQLRPTPTQVMDFVNRNSVSLDGARAMLRLQGYGSSDTERLLGLRHVPLSPETLAAMWNRDIINTQEGHARSEYQGVSAADFDRLAKLGGEPPAVQELLLAWRRGIIDEKDVNRALVQGPLRKEWIDVIKSLQWEPLPLSEAADAVNQGHMSIGAARKVARVNGVRDDDFDIVVANSGLPPGPQETLDWVNRGIISEEQGLQALYESRIKNKWVPTYMKSRHETMPPETVRLMYSRGAIDARDATRRLQIRGYTAADAAIILDGASAEKTATSRDLTQSQIRELYADRAITRDDASAWLQTLGYEADEAVWILELADLQRVRRFFTAATNRVQAAYVSNRIDSNEASALLDRVGVPAGQRDDMLELWDIERDTTSKSLTPSQIVAAVKKGIIDVAAGMRRLVGQGYANDDAAILLALSGIESP